MSMGEYWGFLHHKVQGSYGALKTLNVLEFYFSEFKALKFPKLALKSLEFVKCQYIFFVVNNFRYQMLPCFMRRTKRVAVTGLV